MEKEELISPPPTPPFHKSIDNLMEHLSDIKTTNNNKFNAKIKLRNNRIGAFSIG